MVQNLVAVTLRKLKSFKQTRSWNTLARAEVIVDSDSLYTSFLHLFSINLLHTLPYTIFTIFLSTWPCLPLVYVKLGF